MTVFFVLLEGLQFGRVIKLVIGLVEMLARFHMTASTRLSQRHELVSEMPYAGKYHRHVGAVRKGDDLFIPD